jgi:uncharacterized protein (UPF0276 family)
MNPQNDPHRRAGSGRPPFLGHGVGLRRDHFERVLSGPAGVDWFEVISENFMVDGGRPLHVLTKVREGYPIVLHGVSLSIGSTDPLNEPYLDRLRALAERFEPAWVSDHLCWTGVGGHNAHDLLPLPYTEQALDHVVARVQRVQERLGRPIALENVSSYVAYRHSAMTEWDFLGEVARRSGCGILLDINNIFVSARNHGFDPIIYLRSVPPEAIWQFHLAGHSDKGTYLLDTHDHAITAEVWALYREAVRLFGPVSSLIEWDDRIPPFESLLEESRRAGSIQREALAAPAEADGAALVATSRRAPGPEVAP